MLYFSAVLSLSCLSSASQLDAVSQNAASILHRSRRNAECQVKYSSITSGHSACLPASPDLRDEGVSQEDIQIILDDHNEVRRAVSPTATNMREMTWDEEIANTAQRWASSCNVGQHDKNYKRYAYGRFSVGQNLSWGSYKMGWRKAVKLWSDEIAYFRYGGRNSLGQVGHYTQMVWATSTKIGCGYALCGNVHYYACNYAPGGNFDINTPYKAGGTCADCKSTCSNKLCDCRGKVCLNGGSMDLNACSCTCKKDLKFFMQPDCALNCTDIEDPWQCDQYGPAGCERYSNVPQECPKMCKWCPTAGANYGVTGNANRPSIGPVRLAVSSMTILLTLLFSS